MSLRHRRAHLARRIALLSDSHGLVQPALLERLQGVDLIVHAGDVGGRSVLRELKAIAPLCAVAGNNDTPRQWPTGEARSCTALAEVFRISLVGGTLVVIHGHQFAQVASRHTRLRAAFPDARCIVYGHSHRRCLDVDDTPWVVNPGASGKARAYDGAGGWLLSVAADGWSLAAL